MRIAIVGTLSQSMVSFRGPLLMALHDQGHDVYAFAHDYSEETKNAVRNHRATPVDYSLERTGTNVLADSRTVFELRRLFIHHRIDRVLAYFIKPVIYGATAARLAGSIHFDGMIEGLGYIFTDQPGAAPFKKRSLETLVRAMYRTSLAYAKNVIFLNPDDRREFIEKRLVTAEKALCLGGIGVDLSVWTQVRPMVQPVTFVMVARILKSKGVLEYLAAAQIVKERWPTSRFFLLGTTDEGPDGIPVSTIAAYVDSGILDWPGWVSNVPDYLKDSSVFVLPSYREGVPRSTQEAMALGRAIITTDAPGCRETVIEGVNGFLVPPRNPNAISDAMQRFLTEPSLIMTMGAASRTLAEERFDAQRFNNALIKVLGFGT